MNKNDTKWIEKSIPSAGSVPPPPKREERSIPQTPKIPAPPSKSGNEGKK